MYPYPIYYPFTSSIYYYKEDEEDKEQVKEEKKVDEPLPPRDKVCSLCGQQYHWCVCHLNKYQ
jgi:hypothetical protein